MRVNNNSSQVLFPDAAQNQRRQFDKEKNYSRAGDSVSISPEASALAQEMRAKGRTESTQYTDESINAKNPNATNPEAKAAKNTASLSDLYDSYFLLFRESKDDDKSASTSSSSSSSGLQKKIDAIEKQIKKLEGQIEQVASSDAPDVVKESQISALEQQIDALSSQLASLKSAMKTGSGSKSFMGSK